MWSLHENLLYYTSIRHFRCVVISPHPSSKDYVSDYSCKIMVLTYWVWSRRLWSSSLSCDNNLIDRENRSRGLGRKLDSPTLRNHKIKDTLGLSIETSGFVIILVVISTCFQRYGTVGLTSISTPVVQLSFLWCAA